MMPKKERLTLQRLDRHHNSVRDTTQERLGQFRRYRREPSRWQYHDEQMRLLRGQDHDQSLFEEYAFCVFAANTSAEMGMTAVDTVRDVLRSATPEQMTRLLRGKYRFINLRPAYLAHSREYLERTGHGFRELLEGFADAQTRRDFLADNHGLKGMSYKEASHFLRNCGFGEYAILDKHILNCLTELGVVESNRPPRNRAEYLAVEEKMKDFSLAQGIGMDELDLLLWSWKTGKVLK